MFLTTLYYTTWRVRMLSLIIKYKNVKSLLLQIKIEQKKNVKLTNFCFNKIAITVGIPRN